MQAFKECYFLKIIQFLQIKPHLILNIFFCYFTVPVSILKGEMQNFLMMTSKIRGKLFVHSLVLTNKYKCDCSRSC